MSQSAKEKLGPTKLKAKSLPRLEPLYLEALKANRTGPLYGAFPYPTKLSAETAALYIASHTKPDDTIFDGFGGSGTTGLAARLCGNPTSFMRGEAERLNLPVKWGSRNAIIYELSVVGALIGKTLTNPPDPSAFALAARTLLAEAEMSDSWMYSAKDPEGKLGVIRHVVWSDIVTCEHCLEKGSVWDGCVSLKPAAIDASFTCPTCGKRSRLDQLERVSCSERDRYIDCERHSRKRTIARVYGATGSKKWSRPIDAFDLEVLEKVENEGASPHVPVIKIPWGDLYRSGYHQGISHLHHFYTGRNLLIFARLWERVRNHADLTLRDALSFWLLSYNASHSTIMTRIVAKSGQPDVVVTSAQSGVLYVSGLPVEKNILRGLSRKLETILRAFEIVVNCPGTVEVIEGSSCATKLASSSIDYIFTDPPFGSNIPYAELNFINEAWIGRLTPTSDEAIVSRSQNKDTSRYCSLLTSAFSEFFRILKPSRKATVVFHSASSEIWNAIQTAYSASGFQVEFAGVLDKVQASFKQTRSPGSVRGDPIFLLAKREAASSSAYNQDIWAVAEKLKDLAQASSDPTERSPQRLYSRLVGHFLRENTAVSIDAEEFYRWHSALVDKESLIARP